MFPKTNPADADEWIRRLELVPHPEGGYFRETYRAPLRVTGAEGRVRNASTAIYFLLRRGQFSALHRISSDELWHFYAGGSLAVHAIFPDGTLSTWKLGMDIASGESPQCVVPAGAWFGAELVEDDPATDFALVGCTVAPGFEFHDFELANRADLISCFPRHAELIARLTHAPE